MSIVMELDIVTDASAALLATCHPPARDGVWRLCAEVAQRRSHEPTSHGLKGVLAARRAPSQTPRHSIPRLLLPPFPHPLSPRLSPFRLCAPLLLHSCPRQATLTGHRLGRCSGTG